MHVKVDTELQEDRLSIKAFVSSAVTLGEKQLGTQFHRVAVNMRMVEAERVGSTRPLPPPLWVNNFEGVRSLVGDMRWIGPWRCNNGSSQGMRLSITL